MIVSDFREEADGWQSPLRALAHRHELVCVEIVDPREAELPDAGLVVMVDPETGRHVEADLSSPRLREAFAAAERARTLKLHTEMRRAGARHVVLRSEGDWLRGMGAGLARSRGS